MTLFIWLSGCADYQLRCQDNLSVTLDDRTFPFLASVATLLLFCCNYGSNVWRRYRISSVMRLFGKLGFFGFAPHMKWQTIFKRTAQTAAGAQGVCVCVVCLEST